MAVVHGRKSCFAMLYARDGLLRKKSEGLEGGGASHSLEGRERKEAMRKHDLAAPICTTKTRIKE